VRVCFGGT